jgi:F-type H+-transporting ATPase subunit delta
LSSSDISKRYSDALFDIAKEEKNYEKYFDDLKRFSAILEENANLREVLYNPIFEKDEKKAVVGELMQMVGVADISANFLKLLVDKGRIAILDEIVSAYQMSMDQALNKARVNVRTAFPLSDDATAEIRRTMESLTRKQVEMVIEEDPSLLAGIVIKIGDTLYDGSVKAQLNKIRELLGEEI